MPRNYLAELQRRVLIFDGSMGATLQTLELTADDFGGSRFEGCMGVDRRRLVGHRTHVEAIHCLRDLALQVEQGWRREHLRRTGCGAAPSDDCERNSGFTWA